MKTLLVFMISVVGIFAMQLNSEQKSYVEALEKECFAETGIDEAVFENAKMKTIDDFFETVGCFPDCVFRKMGIITENGIFNEQKFREYNSLLPFEVLTAVIEKCKSEVTDDSCSGTTKLIYCFSNKSLMYK